MKRAMLALIRFYQRQISPWFPRRCPFFSDLLAVRPRGDLTLWRDAGRMAGVQTADAV